MSQSRVARRRLRHQLPRIPECSTERVGKLNIYTCPKAHRTITVDRDAGTTPAFISCPWPVERGNPPLVLECARRSASAWYRVPDIFVPSYEWYRPDDTQRRTLDKFQTDHVNRGGLLLRLIETQEIQINGQFAWEWE